MKLFLYPVLALACSPAFAQTDTMYLNAQLEMSARKLANSYLVYEKAGNEKYKGKNYDMQGRIKDEGEYASVFPVVRDGSFTVYDTVGAKWEEGAYASGKKQGLWKEYYHGSAQIHAELSYDKGEPVGELKSYYPDGKLKRVQQFKGQAVTGKCYTTAGEEMPFTPYEQMPVFPGDIVSYIGENLQYPKPCRQKDIQGRVLVQFVVDEQGQIADAKVMKSAHELLDKEALRVVNNMPAWKPGMQDDVAVKVYYSIPIAFRLTD